MVQTAFRQTTTRLRPDRFRVEFVRWAQFSWRRGLAMSRHDPRLLLWNMLWLPFWIGSDTPPPEMPQRGSAATTSASIDPAGVYLGSRIDWVTRRFGLAWFGGSLLRGFALALGVLTFWSLLAVLDIVALPGWASVIAAITVGLAVGFVYGLLSRPDRMMVAGMLDRTFDLRERMVTAFDRPGDPSHISRLQLADAANTFDEIMTEVPRSTYAPVREAAICLIMAGALVTMMLAYVPRQGIAALSDSPVPQFVPASERLAVRDQPDPRQLANEQPISDQASIAEIQERGRESQSTRDDLARIGDALQTSPLTQPAAESISSGDYAAAADSLRSASASAAAMSQEERDALGDDLEQASRQISDANPELSQAANEAAEALRDGGPGAEEALNALADEIDESSEKVQSEEDLARDLDEAQSGSSDPAASDGESAGSEQSGSSQSQSSSDQQGEQGAGSDPGQGASAEPGVSNQPSESPAQSSNSESSEGSPDQGSGSASSDSAGQEPSDGQPGEGSSEEAGSDADGGSSSSDAGLQGAPQDETDASQGSGAGTGQSGANDQSSSDQRVDDPADPEENPDAEIPGIGEAGDPPASREDRGEEDDGTGTTRGGSTSLELQGTSDSSGIQTGGDSGSSSLGSGSDSSTASGDQTAGDVGVAGPDSNRVPDALRDVVKDYFGEPAP